MGRKKSKNYFGRMTLEKEIQDLKKKIVKLEEENNILKKEKDNITEEKDKIIQEKKKLEKEFEEYKVEHAITVENLQKALKIKKEIKSHPNNIGAKKNHVGYQRHIPERIDYIKEVKLSRCPECGEKLGSVQEVRTRHITDIKLVSNACTTKYNISRYYCTHCKKIVEKKIPEAFPYAKFGLNLMLIVMYLRLGLMLPFGKITAYFMDVHQIKISKGAVVCILRQLVKIYGSYYEWLEKIIKKSRVKQTDTTSWRINGHNYYVWVFVALGVVLYKIRKHNNSKTAVCLFGKFQKNSVLVIDRFSALRALGKKLGFLLQFCWSHILSDSKDLAKNFGSEGKYVHKKLKQIYALAKGLNHNGNQDHVIQLKAEIFQLTLRNYKHNTVRKFINNLYYRDGDNLFRFVTDSDVDSTNNLSERELRSLVILRKITNGSRSTCGANITAMLMSVVQTLRLKNINILTGLKNIANQTSGY